MKAGSPTAELEAVTRSTLWRSGALAVGSLGFALTMGARELHELATGERNHTWKLLALSQLVDFTRLGHHLGKKRVEKELLEPEEAHERDRIKPMDWKKALRIGQSALVHAVISRRRGASWPVAVATGVGVYGTTLGLTTVAARMQSEIDDAGQALAQLNAQRRWQETRRRLDEVLAQEKAAREAAREG